MDDQNSAESAIEKLNALLDNESITIFTNEEAKALKEVAIAWKSAKGFVHIASLMGATLKWCVAMGLAWAAFKTGLFGFLKGDIVP